jgi:hypothetical protein
MAFHVNLRVVACFHETVSAHHGTIFTAHLQEFSDRGILVMPANLTAGGLAAALSGHGPDVVNRLLADIDRTAVFTGPGWVRAAGMTCSCSYPSAPVSVPPW